MTQKTKHIQTIKLPQMWDFMRDRSKDYIRLLRPRVNMAEKRVQGGNRVSQQVIKYLSAKKLKKSLLQLAVLLLGHL